MPTTDATPTAWVVLLRGVNLGPHRRVSSAELRDAAAAAGLTGARTYAASGNLVAVAAGTDTDAEGAAVADRVAAALVDRLGSDVRTVALSAARAADLVAADPFPDATADHPSHVQVHVGPAPVDPQGVARLEADNPGGERFAVAAGVLYVDYVDGIGRSRLTAATIDRAAGTWTTARNWNTLTRLATMAGEPT